MRSEKGEEKSLLLNSPTVFLSLPKVAPKGRWKEERSWSSEKTEEKETTSPFFSLPMLPAEPTDMTISAPVSFMAKEEAAAAIMGPTPEMHLK